MESFLGGCRKPHRQGILGMKNQLLPELIDNNHWRFENFSQRMTLKEWKRILLENKDTIIFKGQARKLIGKRIFPGVIEISKEPLKNNP